MVAKLDDMEKRTAHRQRVFKAGMIEFPGGAFSCVVRNLSDRGANLDLPSVIGIPHEFTLSIPSAQFRFFCRAVWRSDRRIGVAFALGADSRLKGGLIVSEAEA